MKIMFCGRKGSGKDASVAYLISKYNGLDFSFAKPLYDMMYFCQDTMGIQRYKDRRFLTTMGDFFRDKDADIFINRCFALTKACLVSTYIVDGRYLNELEAGKSHGFTIIQIKSSNEVRQQRRPGENILDEHSSENGYPEDYPFDYTITNDGTLEELYHELDEIVKSLRRSNNEE